MSLASRTHSRLDRLASIMVIFAVLVLLAVLVRHEGRIRGEQGRGSEVVIAKDPTPGWEKWSSVGIWSGNPQAPVRLVVFTDYQCPYCAELHLAIRRAQSQFGSSLGILYMDFPLSYHEWALPAARMAECGFRAGKLDEVASALYRHQRGPGRSTTDIAHAAGLKNPVQFEECVQDSLVGVRVAKAESLGRRIGIASTPTVFVNGYRIEVLPADSLSAVIRRFIE